ncbi:MAG: magnesium transporter [Myxococcota bacterium]|jgi:magnesium transporter
MVMNSMRESAVPAELSSRIEAGDSEGCADWLDHAEPRDAVYTLSHLTDRQRESLLSLLSPEDAADVFDQLQEAQAVDAIEHLEAGVAARIIEILPSDEQADIIGDLESEEAEAILEALSNHDAADVRRLVSYDETVAGGLMQLEFLAFRRQSTVREVLDDLERNALDYARFQVQYTYVVDDHKTLEGVVPVRELLLARRTATLADIMLVDPVSVSDTASLDELTATFHEKPYIGLPVVDAAGRLVGVVERSDVQLAQTEDVEEQFRQSQGIVGGEELRSMPLVTRSKRRLAWLSINIALNVMAASIIAIHQETLESVIALAVFLPIISDMSGCSGSQAVAVSIRELTLGVTRPRDLFVVLSKELSLGLINGIALGVLIAFVAIAWKGNPYFGAVVGTALAVNTVVAVAIGGSIPLVLKGMNLDPALASGPVLTTVTDMCGFLLVLSLAAAAMPYLGGM